jgi:DNA-binding transcriptional regulator YiaG
MAEVLRVDSSTVRRWLSGKVAIPGPAEVALELLLKAENKNGKN